MSILILDDNIKDDVVARIKSFFSSLDCDTDFETVMRCDVQPFSDWASNEWGIVSPDFECGSSFVMGVDCIIEPDVIVGDSVTLGHNVILKSGTRIGNDVVMGDNCCTTGVCKIGNHVRIRTGSVISKGVIVDDWVFIGAGVMTSHTKNVSHGRPQMEPRQLLTRIGYGAIVGSRCNLMAGITIAPGVIVGYDSNVTKDLFPLTGSNEPFVHYIALGNPAVFTYVQKQEWRIEIPDNYTPHSIDAELLAKYLPHYKGD